MNEVKSHVKISYLTRVFLLIGSSSFGGYMALIAMLRDKIVKQDKVASDELITEGIALASALPGPVAVNVVAYCGYALRGVAGALVSVGAVLLPSFILVLLLSMLFVSAGELTTFVKVLWFVTPVVIAIITSVGVDLARKNVKLPLHYVILGVSIVGQIFLKGYTGLIGTLAFAALLGALFLKPSTQPVKVSGHSWKPVIAVVVVLFAIWIILWLFLQEILLAKIFVLFSQVSLTLFGGGYVMVPVLESLLVEQLAWVNHAEFSYGIAIGQVTPGPILVSAAFFGYKMAGFAGALIATIAIFLPSASLMIACSGIYMEYRSNKYVQGALDGLKPAIAALIVFSAVTMFLRQINESGIWLTSVICAISLLIIYTVKVKPVLIVLAFAILGIVVITFEFL